MRNARCSVAAAVGCVVLLAGMVFAQDWPQWRGVNRDGKATGFKAPATWPKELKSQWKVTVGDGDASPALVGDKLYVFSRQDGDEVLTCLNAADGKEIWKSKYEVPAISGPDANQHGGPRSSPAVADGKVVTLGVTGVVCCFDAASGKLAWRKDDYAKTSSWPRFHTASSPLIVDGLCVAQVGGPKDGAVVAYDLASGAEKWKWTGEGPGYASPVLMSIDGLKVIIAETEKSILALNAADGKDLWQIPFAAQGMAYNASTPVVNGQTLIYAGQGRGVKAVKLSKEGDKLTAKDLWSNAELSPQFNSLILKDGCVYGITQAGRVFCLNAETGAKNWDAALAPAAGGGRMGGMGMGAMVDRPMLAAMRGGRGGMGGGSGYGSLIDAGSVIMAMTPAGELIVFQPSDKQFTEVARIKVASTPVYAYPVLSGNRLFIKDKDSLAMFVVE